MRLSCLCYNYEQMKPLNKAGFTIIETMLFLGISGLLAVGVLIGSGVSINTQRYRDSVTSLQSFLQQQYSDVSNVSNDATSSTCNGVDNNPRGQSDCVILGRYITTTDSKKILVKAVIGSTSDLTIATNDVEALKQFNIKVSPSVGDTYDVQWGSSINRTDGSDMVFSMLVLRSPSSGAIRTFVNNTTSIPESDIVSLLSAVPSALTQSAELCVNSNGLFTGNKMAVFIDKNTTSSSGVSTLGEQNQALLGASYICR